MKSSTTFVFDSGPHQVGISLELSAWQRIQTLFAGVRYKVHYEIEGNAAGVAKRTIEGTIAGDSRVDAVSTFNFKEKTSITVSFKSDLAPKRLKYVVDSSHEHKEQKVRS